MKSKEELTAAQAESREKLEVEARNFMRYELRWRVGYQKTDFEMRNKFARIIDRRLSQLSVISMQLAEFDDAVVSHG